MTNKPHICFVAQNSFGTLSRLESGFIGGIELQMPMMARWFKERGYPVSMICWDEGFGSETVVDGIRVISTCRREDGLPGLRFITPRWVGLARALRRADPDVIYYNYGDLEFGQIVLWAHRNNVPVVYSVANNMVCQRDLPSFMPWREKLLYRYGLTRVDRIITQTYEERETLRKDFGLHSVVIPMPNPGFAGSGLTARLDEQKPRVLWVGRFTPEKRLEWLLDIAEALPHVEFDVVGGANLPTDYAQRLVARANCLKNVTMHGRVIFDRMGEFYARASLLLSTSVFEGFPNVYLEAWSVGLPVVATIDPDRVIETKQLGAVARTRGELASCVERMLQRDLWERASLAGKEYMESTHLPERVLSSFEEQIRLATSSRKSRRRRNVEAERRPSICFVGLNCYNLLAKRADIAHIGGAEVQQMLAAEWLIQHGYDVSFVTHDHGQSSLEYHDDIKVYKAYDKSAGVPIIRFFFPRWFRVCEAMSRAKSDVYYQRGAGVETGQVALWCKWNRKRFIFGCANDADCTSRLSLLKTLKERVLFRIGLRLSDAVIAQTEAQQRLLKENFHKGSLVVRNSCRMVEDAPSFARERNRVLWVGRFSQQKRFEWLIEIAKRAPDYQFTVVGAQNTESSYGRRLQRDALRVPNIKLEGWVPHEDMAKYYYENSLLCSTSIVEGFPNVYLEAWRAGMPVLSSIDPDQCISKSSAGWVRESVDGLVEVLDCLRREPELWQSAATAARKHVVENHRLEANMPNFELLLGNVFAGAGES